MQILHNFSIQYIYCIIFICHIFCKIMQKNLFQKEVNFTLRKNFILL